MPGETYLRHVYKHDHVYALCFHPDCEAFDQEYRTLTGEAYGEDGWGPLLDDLLENGDYEAECAAKQDKYPDVIRRFRQALTTRRP